MSKLYLERARSVSRDGYFLLDSIFRDFDMAEEMGKLYCAALKERRPLVINVGSDHVPRLLSLLRQFGGTDVPVRLSERSDLLEENTEAMTRKYVKTLSAKPN